MIDIFFLLLTLVLGGLLYLRLGRRTGHEKNPFSYAQRFYRPSSSDAPTVEMPVADVPFINSIKQIQQIDKGFSPETFLDFARTAFEQIVTTYVKGNLQDLKNLLTQAMYVLYEKEKAEQEKKKLKGDLLFFRLISAKIKNIKVEKSTAEIQVWFVSEQTQILKDAKDKVVEGDEKSIDRISEMWTFQKLITRKNEDWVLSAVGAHAEV